MKTRKEINTLIDEKQELIKKLALEIKKLKIENYILCDEEQWYTEIEEVIITNKRPLKKERTIIGLIHFKEDFTDKDTGRVVTINRCQQVKLNDTWFY